MSDLKPCSASYVLVGRSSLGLRTLPSPSPLPSPLERGCCLRPRSPNPARLDLSKRWMRFSLSFGERAGVRGNRALTTLLSLVLLAKADAASPLPPSPAREFRGVWVASVNNIDWPSKPALPVAQQKAELRALLDTAAQLKLNAVILQVRPSCDALYASPFEPWSEYLTGRMNLAPQPLYDPLTFAIEQAHQRGLELHAWFNPFRAHHPTGKSGISTNHISRTQPALVKNFGANLWLDPGEKAAREYSLKVILDVVQRYDLDGVHLDDYFYPYPEKDAQGKYLDFPDWASWSRYIKAGGKLNRQDWRRDNVNQFVERLYHNVKARKPWVKVGISPFGIWRPGQPASVRGLDSYETLCADSRAWLARGWLDYFTPQLYWLIDAKEQSFSVLLQWWAEQNPQQRHLWPGCAASRVGHGWPAEEILNEIKLTRRQSGVTGHVCWSMKALRENRLNLTDKLRSELYTQPALVPASTWLDGTPPATPQLTVTNSARADLIKISWVPGGEEKVWLWVIQSQRANQWTTEILPGGNTSRTFEHGTLPDSFALSAVDRCGNVSTPARFPTDQPARPLRAE